jgi:hypothetical protein
MFESNSTLSIFLNQFSFLMGFVEEFFEFRKYEKLSNVELLHMIEKHNSNSISENDCVT